VKRAFGVFISGLLAASLAVIGSFGNGAKLQDDIPAALSEGGPAAVKITRAPPQYSAISEGPGAASAADMSHTDATDAPYVPAVRVVRRGVIELPEEFAGLTARSFGEPGSPEQTRYAEWLESIPDSAFESDW